MAFSGFPNNESGAMRAPGFSEIAALQNVGPDILACTARPSLGVLLTWSVSPSHTGDDPTRTVGNGKFSSRERAIIRGTARPGPPRPSSNREACQLQSLICSLPWVAWTRHDVRRVGNLPRP